ncbi:MAG TPA: GNAT family N-acetyltransferase [Bacteroidia bacterium]|nr:GNAT family N-acetyltransferase [Bacteroidia bacterium]
MQVSLRRATFSDLPLIADLADRIWRVHYTPIIGAEQVDYMLEKMYDVKHLTKQMEEGQKFFLVYADKKPLGYLSISSRNEKDYFLHKFYLEIDQQGKGIGKKAFSQLLSEFPAIETIRLQVNRMNYKTVNFYFRLGFVIEEAKDFDIGSGYFMEDYVMVYIAPGKK